VIACAVDDDKLAVCREHAPTRPSTTRRKTFRERIKALTGATAPTSSTIRSGGSYTEPRCAPSPGADGCSSSGSPPVKSRKSANLTLLKALDRRRLLGDWPARADAFREAMARLDRWYADGKLKPHISATFPLERAADALTLMASRKVTGKVVLTAG